MSFSEVVDAIKFDDEEEANDMSMRVPNTIENDISNIKQSASMKSLEIDSIDATTVTSTTKTYPTKVIDDSNDVFTCKHTHTHIVKEKLVLNR